MKKLGFATVIAGGLFAGILGVAAPASAAVSAAPTAAGSIVYPAGIDHHSWLDQISPKVNVPQVDSTVRHSGR